MDEQSIRVLVERVLSEQAAATLVLLTPAIGYRHEIAARLRQWKGIRWEILASEDAEDEQAVLAGLGKSVCWDGKQAEEWLNCYEQVVIPFLDFATLAEISIGLYQSQSSQLCQYALMKGIPVYALDYQCNPASELNQLMGLDHSRAMTARAMSQLTQLGEMGVVTGNLVQVEAVLTGMSSAETEQLTTLKPEGYITLSDVKNKGVNAFSLQDNLTDLAAEYLKEQQQQS